MRKLFPLFLLLFANTTLWAYDFRVGDLCYNITSQTAPYTVEVANEIGKVASNNYPNLTTANIPSSVVHNDTTYVVTGIGDYAFWECETLASLTIPESVTYIGKYALASCNCESLISVVIPNSVTSIGEGAFHSCIYLTSINIPNGITRIEPHTFALCIAIPSITIPENVTSIGEQAFLACASMTSLTIPNSVTTIEKAAFHMCLALESVTIPNSVTHISGAAFADCQSLTKVTLGTGVKEIGEQAFGGEYTTKLYDIYCYATNPPKAFESTFTNYNAIVHVSCENYRAYYSDIVWGNFKQIECIGAENGNVVSDSVIIVPSTNSVSITWPTHTDADTYIIVIKKGDEIFCTLTFNAEGQLLNIAFAPGRNGNHPAQYAEQAGNGYRFTVTGLTEATQYTYSITTKDAENQPITTYSGEFTTLGTPTSVSDIQLPMTNCQKIIRDNQLLIIRDGKTYNAMGQEM